MTDARRPVSRVLSARDDPMRPPMHVTAIPLRRRLLGAFGNQPGRLIRITPASRQVDLTPAGRPYSVLLPVGFAVPVPLPVPRCALTAPFHPCPRAVRQAGRSGGLFSVALSLGSPPPAVSRHRDPVEPGLSSTRATRANPRSRGSGRPAVWRGTNARIGRQGSSPPEDSPPSSGGRAGERVLHARTTVRAWQTLSLPGFAWAPSPWKGEGSRSRGRAAGSRPQARSTPATPSPRSAPPVPGRGVPATWPSPRRCRPGPGGCGSVRSAAGP